MVMSVTLDFDSTVIGVHGSQEGAAKGFNPNSIGQNSYHPLLCFIAENKECLHSLVFKRVPPIQFITHLSS